MIFYLTIFYLSPIIANPKSKVNTKQNCFCKNIPNKIAVKNFPQQISAAPVLRLTFIVK